MENEHVTGFLLMARDAGLPRKGMYTLGEVSQASGIPLATLREEANLGHIQTFLPQGRVRGKRVRPEWIDEWMESCTRKVCEWQ